MRGELLKLVSESVKKNASVITEAEVAPNDDNTINFFKGWVISKLAAEPRIFADETIDSILDAFSTDMEEVEGTGIDTEKLNAAQFDSLVKELTKKATSKEEAPEETPDETPEEEPAEEAPEQQKEPTEAPETDEEVSEDNPEEEEAPKSPKMECNKPMAVAKVKVPAPAKVVSTVKGPKEYKK